MAEVKLQSSSQASSKKNFRTVKQEEPLIVTRAPHIHSGRSIAGRMWPFVLALTPIVLAAVFTSGTGTLRLILHSVSAAIIFEFISEKVSKRSVRIWDGSAFYWGLLFALCMPQTTPSLVIWIAMLPIILINKLQTNRFNPIPFSLIALSCAYSSTPALANHPVCIAAIIFAGIFLALRRLIPWQNSLVFLAVIACGANPALALFAAVFFVTDSVTIPLTFWGRAYFSLIALVASSYLVFFMNSYQGILLGLMIAQLFVPLIDRYVRIRPIGTRI